MDLITEDLICRYNGYLASRGVIRNSISFYNRTLRAIYNKAVRRFNASDTLPFRDVYTGIDKTRSRAIDEKQEARLADLKFGGNKNLEVARDLFIFSYATRDEFCGYGLPQEEQREGELHHILKKKERSEDGGED